MRHLIKDVSPKRQGPVKLQQLVYATKVAECGSVAETARRLFVAQPSITAAIRELDREMSVHIFERTNKGMTVSEEGSTFLGYARQVIEQAELLESKYKTDQRRTPHFSVSCQHYSFAVNAFVDVIRQFDAASYDFTLREEQTHEIIEDVSHIRSELGILYLSGRNREVIQKMLTANDLAFETLFRAEPHVFVCSAHPLAKSAKVTLDDLADYPFLSYEQGGYNSFSEVALDRCDGQQESLRSVYPSDEALFEAIAAAYRTVIADLYAAGCRNIQFDDCTWGIYCDTDFVAKTGMSPVDIQKVSELGVALNNAAIEGAPADLAITTHVCRGNYHSTYAFEGGYDPIAPYLFANENVQAFYLEFDTPRAGGFEPLKHVAGGKKVVLGLVTSKQPGLEDEDVLIARINEAAQYVPLENLYLSPQCGFASCEIGNKLTEEKQWAKIALIQRVAKRVWGE